MFAFLLFYHCFLKTKKGAKMQQKQEDSHVSISFLLTYPYALESLKKKLQDILPDSEIRISKSQLTMSHTYQTILQDTNSDELEETFNAYSFIGGLFDLSPSGKTQIEYKITFKKTDITAKTFGELLFKLIKIIFEKEEEIENQSKTLQSLYTRVSSLLKNQKK